MSMSDDPRDFRRGQPANQRYSASQGRDEDPRMGQRGENQDGDDRYSSYRQPAAPAEQQERPARERQPSFSAYRPEAYASSSRAQGRPEQAQWEEPPRAAPVPPRHDPRDLYHGNAADPYAPPQAQPQRNYEPPRMQPPRDFETEWREDDFSADSQGGFENYYPQADEPAPDADAQSVHDSYFAAADPVPAPPPRAAPYRAPEFNEFGDAQNEREQAFGAGFENDQDYGWDNFDQTPPASARPFHAPMPLPEDDLDADFFADEDDFDGEDYALEKGSGRKKLMAAVLVGAVVTGGGLAYVYKNNSGGGTGGEPPIVTADSGPVKETPADPGGRDFPNGNKLIYDRLIDGESAQPTRTDEGSAETDGEILQGGVTTPGTLEERINQALEAQQGRSSGSGQSGDLNSPRRVQTLTIRPDGSVDQSGQAGNLTSQNIQTADLSNDVIISQQPEDSGGADLTSSANDAGSDILGGSETQDSGADLLDSGNSDSNDSVQVAEVTQPQTEDTSQVAELTGGTGEYFVQIGARNDQEAAETAFKTLQKKYASILGNHKNYVRKVDLGEKGVWYRLWVGPVNTKGDAEQLCSELKNAGMPACLTRKDNP